MRPAGRALSSPALIENECLPQDGRGRSVCARLPKGPRPRHAETLDADTASGSVFKLPLPKFAPHPYFL